METDAKYENLSVIGDFIVQSMKEFHLEERLVFQIQLAVDEACSNIIIHGYTQKKGKIHITCYKEGKEVSIVIEDWGKPWDPKSVKKPDIHADIENREIGGLGIHFIDTVMDEIIYQNKNGKNILTMRKTV